MCSTWPNMRKEFRLAVQECNARCLRQSSKWLSEQLLGMNEKEGDRDISPTDSDLFAGYSAMNAHEFDVVMFSNSILQCGEYQRAVQYMRNLIFQGGAGSGRTVSAVSYFIYLYALYMAGEQLKDQRAAESASASMAAGTGSACGAAAAPKQKSGEGGGNGGPGSSGSSNALPKNPCLMELFNDLHPKYMATFGGGGVDCGGGLGDLRTAPGAPLPGGGFHVGRDGGVEAGSAGVVVEMDAFLLYLYGVVVRDLRRQGGGALSVPIGGGGGPVPSAFTLLLTSCVLYPLNWSAWLELAEVCVVDKVPLPFDEGSLTGLLGLCGRVSAPGTADPVASIVAAHLKPEHRDVFRTMSLCFLAHAYLEQQAGDCALAILQRRLLPVFPNSQVVQSQIALSYYTQRDYNMAQQCFESSRDHDPYRLEHIDTYSNILYVKEARSELSYLAHSVTKVNKFSPQTCCVVGNYYSLKGRHEQAIVYFRRALKVNMNYLSAWTLMGHEFVELKNTSAAVYCYRRSIEISETDYRAWYGLGQTYEMLHLYQYAYYYFRKAALLRPHDARMWCAIGELELVGLFVGWFVCCTASLDPGS